MCIIVRVMINVDMEMDAVRKVIRIGDGPKASGHGIEAIVSKNLHD